MLAGGGPWMAVLGAVYTDRPIVQRLTDMLWVGHSTTHQEARVQHLARVFLALRECVRDLKEFYDNLLKNINELPSFDKKKLDVSHPAGGVEDLAPILPRHDLEIMNALLNQVYPHR